MATKTSSKPVRAGKNGAKRIPSVKKLDSCAPCYEHAPTVIHTKAAERVLTLVAVKAKQPNGNFHSAEERK